MPKKTTIRKKREPQTKTNTIGNKKKRPLTLEHIREVAVKTQEDKFKNSHFNTEEAMEKSESNLTGAKTVGGKMKSLANLRVQTPEKDEFDETGEHNLRTLEVFNRLTDLEKEYYVTRMKDFKRDFEFNNSSDWGLLNRIIIEEIVQGRLYGYQLDSPEKNYSEQISQCARRHKEALESLGASRKERLKIKKEDTTVNIAGLVKDFDDERRKEKIFSEREDFIQEEKDLSRKKLLDLEEEKVAGGTDYKAAMREVKYE